MYVVGIDVGGTFTDLVCSGGEHTWRAKSPTVPEDFSVGVLGACDIVASQLGIDTATLLARVSRFGLGTTAVTNVLATKRGLKVGLITTRGFEGHLHAARGTRVCNDGWLSLPWIPVDRRAVIGISERMDREGAVLSPLDPAEVEHGIRLLCEKRGIEALAISMLWSCRNPEHEQRAGAVVRALYPDLPMFLGSELHPLMREFERTSMAVLSAFAAHALDGVEELEAALKARGLRVPVLILHSGGGAMSVREARISPLGLASSGPAAGAVAAGEIAKSSGFMDSLCCDMGGTSTDVAVVRNGIAQRRQNTEINGIATGQSAVDVESIGAGGGSIAWIDTRGAVRVGPQSARAIPGPVCYERGGTQPTVTDAMVVLGYLDPNSFMGGRMRLNAEAAHAACSELGRQIGLDAIGVALGIREIALAEMAKAIRARLSRGGLDARKFGIISFGGSGSLFVPTLAQQLGFRAVLTPSLASVLSAYGAATADILREKAISVDRTLPLTTDFKAEINDLKSAVNHQLAADGVDERKRSFHVEADLRLRRQRATLTLPVEGGAVDQDVLSSSFRTLYADRYGPGALMAGTSIELASLRVIGIGGAMREILTGDLNPTHPKVEAKPRESRKIWLMRTNAHSVPVFDFDDIATDQELDGPVLIDARDTTFWAPAGMRVRMNSEGSLLGFAAPPGGDYGP